MMLIQAYAGGEGKVRAHADEHASPAGIVEVDVVMDRPVLSNRINSLHPATLSLVHTGTAWHSNDYHGASET
jgi:hypothetical protein